MKLSDEIRAIPYPYSGLAGSTLWEMALSAAAELVERREVEILELAEIVLSKPTIANRFDDAAYRLAKAVSLGIELKGPQE